ncbi:MAG: DUF5107 domain-containing protein [Candidatus Acidiferrum sp.]
MSDSAATCTRNQIFKFACNSASVLVLLFIAAASSQAQVKVWEGLLNLPTYEEGAPDPNPPFDQFAGTRFNYPYLLRNELTSKRTDHHWRAVYLENEYLKCSVLPDIGGHLYTCVDKISGQPMFYANPSIKKARIGYRGAWAAFGVEFNFPVSHNWVSMSPVNYAYASHDDGSASVLVGNIDRVYGMEWSVELILHPGSTVLEQHVVLSNRSDVRHRFYWWNNAGVQVWDDSHIQYPMRFAAAHGFVEVQKWPIDKDGKDLSIIRNQTDGPVSLFSHGTREDYMGVWNPHTNTGTAHFANYADLPAKKIWSWGVDADGLDWRKALSDNDSAYVELQAGLFRNQETYAFLEPRQSITFTEYWMPVRETGGISRANLAGVVHLQRSGDVLSVALNVSRKLTGTTLGLSSDSASFFSTKLDLSPESVWKKQIHVSNAETKYAFEMKDSNGLLLLRQKEGEYDWIPESKIKVGPQTRYTVPEETRRTEDDWLQLGTTEELDGNLLGALLTYQTALRKYPTSFELLKAAGRLEASLMRFEEALPHLTAAQQRDTTDAEVSYYLGLVHENLARNQDALQDYQDAKRLPTFRAAAALRRGELLARNGALANARDSLEESLRSAPDDLRAHEELVAVLRALGDRTAADQLGSDLLDRFPLSDFLREEMGKPDLAHLAADPYRVLNVSSEYARLGLYARAIEVLSREYPSVPADQSEPGTIPPQDHPLVVYFRGYCREQAGDSGTADYSRASNVSTLYVFPNTTDDYGALKAAIGANGDDGTAHYLLGTWYFARGQTAPALDEWQQARKLNPHLPTLQGSIGLALLRERRDFAAALNAFKEGTSQDSRNVVNYSGAVSAMSLLGRPAAERARILEQYPDLNHMPTTLVYELALSHSEDGNYAAAIGLFRGRYFEKEEGGTDVRQVWLEVQLQQALGLARKKQCHEALSVARSIASPVEGLSFTQDGLTPFLNSARTNYLLGETYSACGQKDDANQKHQLAVRAEGSSEIVWAWGAARTLANYDAALWKARLQSTLSELLSREGTDTPTSASRYSFGLLRIALGDHEHGLAALREALVLPDSHMSHHLSRLALAGGTPR